MREHSSEAEHDKASWTANLETASKTINHNSLVMKICMISPWPSPKFVGIKNAIIE